MNVLTNSQVDKAFGIVSFDFDPHGILTRRTTFWVTPFSLILDHQAQDKRQEDDSVNSMDI